VSSQPRTDRPPKRSRGPFARRGPLDLPAGAKVIAFALLVGWSLVVLFPMYWLFVTSFKSPPDVDKGPFYVPFVDFKPTLDAWHYILVDLGNDTLRPYANTVIVGLTSTTIAVFLGSLAAYALVRFNYRPRVAVALLVFGALAFVFASPALHIPLPIAIAGAAAVFLILLQTVGRRFKRSMSNDTIAFWLISQRILPPIAVAVPIYVLYQQIGLLDSDIGLILTYVTSNIAIVVWLMRDYFSALPKELEESAAVDGASLWRIVRSIVLPISVPGLVATFLIVLVFAWNEFLIALVLTGANAQTMPLQVFAQNATRGPQWWAISVLILIMIAPVVLVAIGLERYISRGILIGAVKG
jgi:multiple sugar transport system permease protein